MFRKQKGSSLALTLIFATTIGIVLAGVGYTLKINLLRSKSVNEALQSDLLRKGNLNNQIDSNSLSNPYSNESIPDSSVGDITIHSVVTSFQPIYYSAELYNSKAYIQYVIEQNYTEGSKTMFNKTVRYNALAPNSYDQYTDDIIPINVPIVNFNNMDDAEKAHRLSDGSILDTEIGYINSFKKDESNNLVLTNGNITISTPAGISADFKTSLGWDLIHGRWTLYIAIYDNSKIYTTNIPLVNITTPAPISPNWGDAVDFSSFPSSPLVLETIWYQPDENVTPKLFIAGKSLGGETIDAPEPSEPISYPQYVEGTNYANGDVVKNNETLYSCKVAGWCKGAAWAYAPGSGSAWSQAWDIYGGSNDSNGGPSETQDTLVFYSFSPSDSSISAIFNDKNASTYNEQFTKDKISLLAPNPAGGINTGKYVYARVGNPNSKYITKLISIGPVVTDITEHNMASRSDTTRSSLIVPTSDNSINYFEIGDNQIFSYYQDSLGSTMKTLSSGQSSSMTGQPSITIPGVGLFWASYRSNGGLYYSIAADQMEKTPNDPGYSNLPVMQNPQRLNDIQNNRVYLKEYGLECITGERSGDDCNTEQTLYDENSIDSSLVPFSVGTIHTNTK
ncbi:hypothetical protein ACFPDQ_04625 [Pseudofrancisella aestuarii]|uniref:Uncharacterized protein n=1 Tax=Pseudofrancisella aestuarii TaxID=2670347 RepID=A0ABV9TB10_9GAMM|nr:hypothetical protein [Pseudofrancisella aestuarii]